MKKPSEIILGRVKETMNTFPANETHSIIREILRWLDENIKNNSSENWKKETTVSEEKIL